MNHAIATRLSTLLDKHAYLGAQEVLRPGARYEFEALDWALGEFEVMYPGEMREGARLRAIRRGIPLEARR